jgi:hypothetical protein
MGVELQCVGVNVFCVHEPQHAGYDPSFSYNIWCAKFYLRHTGYLSPITHTDGAKRSVPEEFTGLGN